MYIRITNSANVRINPPHGGFIGLVPRVGIEPTRPCGQGILPRTTKGSWYPAPNVVLGKSRVPREGVEPSRCCHRWILSPLRLPFRHRGLNLQ